MIIGITTTLNEADGFQRVNVEYINRVAATGAVPILLTPIAGGAEANREHARRVIDLVDGLLITGGGDVHPRYYVPDPAKNRDALGLGRSRQPWAAAPPPIVAPREQKFPSAAITCPTAPSRRPWMAPRPQKLWSPWTVADVLSATGAAHPPA